MRASRPVRALLALAGAAALMASAAPAAAYCRTSTCTPAKCAAAPECDYCLVGGLPLYWPGGCASFSIQSDGSQIPPGISAEVTGQQVESGLAQWMSVDCGGGQHPNIAIFDGGPVVCDRQEYNQDQPNANIWMYRDDAWPYADNGVTIALTTITYNVKTGEIFDADVEINSVSNTITVGDQDIAMDLSSIVTHEAGHFLGLSHSCDVAATMYPSYQPGETGLRSLEADDVAGICAIYPPGPEQACDPTPRHGFSPTCGIPEQEKGCCTTAPGSGASAPGAALLAALLGVVSAAARRRSRGRGKAS